jgi:hypothetical protein
MALVCGVISVCLLVSSAPYVGQHKMAPRMASPSEASTSKPSVISSQETPNDLQTLNAAVSRADRWSRLVNRAYLVTGALALIFTTLTLFSSFFIYRFGNELSDANMRLSDEKDRVSGEKIAIAGQVADLARQKAAQLESDAAPRDAQIPKTFQIEYLAQNSQRVVRVSSYAFDAEGGRLAAGLIKQLNLLGVATQDDSLVHHPAKPMSFGVQVTGSDNDLVNALQAWLGESNLLRAAPKKENAPQASIEISEGVRGFPDIQGATIFVGAKPMPSDDR